MDKISRFEKVSPEQFKKDWINCFSACPDKEIESIYNSIRLPKRATVGSAGYDFYSPIDMTLYYSNTVDCEKTYGLSSGTITVPTGIRCNIKQGWLLQIYPRSSLGFKFGLHLANTVGIIDGDYYFSENEGHIFVKIVIGSECKKDIEIKKGQAFCQGILTPFGITYDDDTVNKRNGGLGSTDSFKKV